MSSDLLRVARECRFYQGALLELAAKLPPEDAALDQLIGDAVAARENEAFVRMVFAALGTGRRLDARHLVEGACLFDDPQQLAVAAMHMSGDVPRALLEAVQGERLGEERHATALLLAGVLCKETENAAVMPDLIVQARLYARRAGHNPLADVQLSLLSDVLHDDGVSDVLRSRGIPPAPDDLKRAFLSELIDSARKSPLTGVPDRPGPVVQTGYTLRRAVPRVGRNDPCPCGSGRKYKKCCLEKDRQRLQESSSVAGLTLDELRDQRERFLKEDDLLDMRSYELARLDPAKIASPLRPLLINRLQLFGELEAAVHVFERIGVPEDLRGHWLDCIYRVAASRRRDLLGRLLALRNDSECRTDTLPLVARLLMADDPGALQIIEEAALAGLQDPREMPVDLAYALLEGRWPALGILVSRGLVAHGPLFDAEMLMEAVLETRDKLNLPPDDPLQPVVDSRYQDTLDGFRDAEALKEAHERLEAKNLELGRVRSRLTGLEADLARKERDHEQQRAAPAASIAAQPSAIEDSAVRDLRRAVASLKADLKERHNERNALRRELKAALEHLERLRKKETDASESEDAEVVEEGWIEEPGPTRKIHPVRIPEFSDRFRDSLTDVPPTAVRRAMALIGRLAAGESGALVGVKHLSANREILRQRVGADYRLLFKLHAKTLELLAMIPRRDLERRINSLMSTSRE